MTEQLTVPLLKLDSIINRDDFFPRRVVEEFFLEDSNITERFESGLVLGELRYPDEDNLKQWNVIAGDRIAIRVTSPTIKGDWLVGNLEFIGPRGDEAKTLLELGRVTFTLRATISKNPNDEVCNIHQFHCFDLLYNLDHGDNNAY